MYVYRIKNLISALFSACINFPVSLFKPILSYECPHSGVTPDKDRMYCPDCGKLIQNDWYIARCSCCGIKLKAMLKNGKIVPQFRYCSNCGGDKFLVEKLDKITFLDIGYAALVKRIVEEREICSTTRCWQEKTYEPPKLTARYP